MKMDMDSTNFLTKLSKTIHKQALRCAAGASLVLLSACGGGGSGGTGSSGIGGITGSNTGTTTVPATSFTVGGSLAGISGSEVVVLQNNLTDNLSLNSSFTSHAFVFATPITGAYAVTVLSAPAGKICTVANAAGFATTHVTNVAVTCAPIAQSYQIAGAVSGLTAGESVVLQNNATNDTTVSTNTTFTFSTRVAQNSAWLVSVKTQPSASKACSVLNGGGVANADVTNVQVQCSTQRVSVAGMVTGLNGTVVLTNNGGDNLNVTANGSFTFATQVPMAGAYNVQVLTHPAGQTCSASNNSGVANAQVLNVQVTCNSNALPSFSIGGNLSGLSPGKTVVLQNNAGDNLSLTVNGAFNFATRVASGVAYSVSVLNQPPGQICTVSNGSATMQGANVSNVSIACVAAAISDASCAGGAAAGVLLEDVNLSINGATTAVCRYTWKDSANKTRTMSLKKQGNGNAGNGGYAVQATYFDSLNNLITVNAGSGGDGGFGYFVSHELYRDFDNGSNNTIAALNGQDDSPLGSSFLVSGTSLVNAGNQQARHRFYQPDYYRWGTNSSYVCAFDPMTGSCSNGATPASTAQHVRYNTPVTIDWYFQSGTDFPRISIDYNIGAAAQAGLLMFDIRGPYGVMEFANSNAGAALQSILWKDDSYLFKTLNNAATPLYSNTPWSWNTADALVNRLHAMSTTDGYESALLAVGSVQPSGLSTDDWSGGFGKDGAGNPLWGNTHRGQNCSVLSAISTNGCYSLPTPSAWTYQGANYSIPATYPAPSYAWTATFNQATTGKKLAWGSTSRLGGTEAGMYSSNIKYDTCWLLGKGTAGSNGVNMLSYTKASQLKAGIATVCAAKF